MRGARLVAGSMLALALAGGGALSMRAKPAGPLRFAISFPASRSAQPLDSRVLLFISDDGKAEPRTQSDQYRANSTQPIFGVDVDRLEPGADVIVDAKVVGWPARSLEDIPPGDYFVQALINRYETFRRADGHTVKMPMGQGEYEITYGERREHCFMGATEHPNRPAAAPLTSATCRRWPSG